MLCTLQLGADLFAGDDIYYKLETIKKKKRQQCGVSPALVFLSSFCPTCLLYLDGWWRSARQPKPLVAPGRHTLTQWPRGKLSVSLRWFFLSLFIFAACRSNTAPPPASTPESVMCWYAQCSLNNKARSSWLSHVNIVKKSSFQTICKHSPDNLQADEIWGTIK